MKTNNKYLIFDTVNCWPAGLDHKLSTLKCAIKEAVYLNRILVLRKFAIWPYQNYIYGHDSKIKITSARTASNARISQDIRYGLKYLDFSNYINLKKTKIYQLEQEGGVQQLKTAFRYIDEKDFDINAYTNNPELIMKTNKLVGESTKNNPKPINHKMLIMENKQLITNEQNDQYEVIVRRTNAHDYIRNAYPLLVSLAPSDIIEHLTDVVLKAMGTDLESVKKRFALYHQATTSEIQNNYQTGFSKEYPLYYAGLHVRGNDAFHLSSIKYGADPHHLYAIVRDALPKGSIIYIMSDIKDLHYFDFLKKDYIVYRYTNFPELTALVSSSNILKVDNAMLYSIEKNILQYAYTKIVRMRRYPKSLYINFSYKVPWRYKLSSFYEYLRADLPIILKGPRALRIHKDIRDILIRTPRH